jgi:hypothetical protein
LAATRPTASTAGRVSVLESCFVRSNKSAHVSVKNVQSVIALDKRCC